MSLKSIQLKHRSSWMYVLCWLMGSIDGVSARNISCPGLQWILVSYGCSHSNLLCGMLQDSMRKGSYKGRCGNVHRCRPLIATLIQCWHIQSVFLSDFKTETMSLPFMMRHAASPCLLAYAWMTTGRFHWKYWKYLIYASVSANLSFWKAVFVLLSQ